MDSSFNSSILINLCQKLAKKPQHPTLYGSAQAKLSQKHRVSFPSHFSKQLDGKELFLLISTLTNALDDEMVVPMIVTLDFLEELLATFSEDEKKLVHMNAYPITPDNHSRIRFPETTWKAIPFKTEDTLLFVSCGKYIQIWKKETLEDLPENHTLKL